MSTVRGTYIDGKVVLDTRAEWPEGTEVVVGEAAEAERLGLSEEDWDDSPEGIADWIAWLDTLQPLILTPADEEQIRKARDEQRAFDSATEEARAEVLRKMFP